MVMIGKESLNVQDKLEERTKKWKDMMIIKEGE